MHEKRRKKEELQPSGRRQTRQHHNSFETVDLFYRVLIWHPTKVLPCVPDKKHTAKEALTGGLEKASEDSRDAEET